MTSLRTLLITALLFHSLGCTREEAPREASSPPAAEGVEGHEEHTEGTVKLAAEAQSAVGLDVVPVASRRLASELSVTGEVVANADREAHVTTRIAGRVSTVLKNVGDHVGRGERLAMLESVELGQAQAVYLQALERWELAGQTATRQRELLRQDLIARKEALAAENALRLARIERDSARNQLALYGLDAVRIATLGRTRTIDPAIPLLAPLAGVIVSRHLTIGEMLRPEAEQPAFTISDVSQLWVDATVFEKDLAAVKVGQRAIVTTAAYPDFHQQGRVSLVSTALEKSSRTATARVVIANPQGRLKPDMTANIRIRVGDRLGLAVPAAAIVREQKDAFVFVRKDSTTFERRPVMVGEVVDGWVPVDAGLKAGETVVSRGSFTLKAEMSKDSFGEHEH